MIATLASTVGLGLLGIDPITAVYLIAMAVRNDKKLKIILFMLSFAVFSVVIGAAIAIIFGASAFDFIQQFILAKDSVVWAFVQFGAGVSIVIFTVYKLQQRRKGFVKKDKHVVKGSTLKYIFIGFLFALSSFTDPTYFAIILIAGDTNTPLMIFIILTIWFMFSQLLAVIVYITIQFGFLQSLSSFVERIKTFKIRGLSNAMYAIFIVVAVLLMINSSMYFWNGMYLF